MGTHLTRSLKASHGIALCGTLLNVCAMDVVQGDYNIKTCIFSLLLNKNKYIFSQFATP